MPVLPEFYLVNVLRTALLLLMLVLYKRYAASIIQSLADINKGRWWNLALIALLFYLLQVAVTVLYIANAVSNTYLLFLFITISFVMCAVYAIVFSNISYMKKDAEDTNRRLRHYMRHHMDAIAAYAKTGDNAAKELEVREIDLIVLLGNLLENALHGCRESGKENKRIEIRIRLQNKRLIILCNNTCPDDLEFADGLPAKKSIGISSIYRDINIFVFSGLEAKGVYNLWRRGYNTSN